MNLTSAQIEAVLAWARQTRGVQEVRLFTGSIGEHDRSGGVDLALTLGGIEVGDPLTLYFFEWGNWQAALSETLGLPVTIHWYDPKGASKVYATYQGRCHVVYSRQS